MQRSPLLWILVLCFGTAVGVRAGDARPLRFETDVRPILKAHCWQCHGEEDEVKGGLDARLARFLLQGGESGPAVVPGKRNQSRLYMRVLSGEMPPGKKRLSAGEINVLARWIDSGAATARPEPKTLSGHEPFTQEEQQHWSFQPIRRPPLPRRKRSQQPRTPIDVFLLSRLESGGVSFGPAADRRTRIRRLYFNFIGLPPTPDAVETFVGNQAPDAHERLVDELLASPRYGERWGRHWLDVAGYADSDGDSETDVIRKWAYKYRDYVIRSLNLDKPWDAFLVEQLAGDELLTPPFQDLTREQADRLIATGFLRMGPDGTGARNGDKNEARNQVVAETIKILSTSLLGLSVGCAQCHAHRYDPITHVDYHRIRAILEPAYDWKKWRVPHARLVSQWPQEVRQRASAVDQELQQLTQKRNAQLDALVRETLARELDKLPAKIQARAKAARETAADKRNPAQQTLIKEYPFLSISRDTIQQFVPEQVSKVTKEYDEKTAAAKKKRPADDDVMCLTEVPGQVSPTRLFARGDFNQPRQEIIPGELSVLNPKGFTILPNDPQLASTGRRLAYARHLTNGRHPLVTRVLVNRFWMHHFGHGLVTTPTDFGMRSAAPSHPKLLDWLAADFVRGDWELKRLHRMVVTSTAYRQVSTRRQELEALDPDNRLLGRMHVRRLEAETLRDSLLSFSGQLSSKMYGEPVPVNPDVSGQMNILSIDRFNSAGQVVRGATDLGEEKVRRTIYIQVRRSMPLGMLETFDQPAMTPNCEQRVSSTVAPQSLVMMNHPFVVREALAFATRIRREAGPGAAAQFQLAWRMAFARPATDQEVRAGVAFLNEQAKTVRVAPATPKSGTPDRALLAMAHLCQALLSSNAFLYVD